MLELARNYIGRRCLHENSGNPQDSHNSPPDYACLSRHPRQVLERVIDAAQRSTCSGRVSYLPEKEPNAGDPSFGTARIYKTTRSDISEEYGRIPLSFEVSDSAESPEVRFVIRVAP